MQDDQRGNNLQRATVNREAAPSLSVIFSWLDLHVTGTELMFCPAADGFGFGGVEKKKSFRKLKQ